MYYGKINREIKLCFTVPGNLPCTITKVLKIAALRILTCRAEKWTRLKLVLSELISIVKENLIQQSPSSSQKKAVSHILSLILKFLITKLLQFSNKRRTTAKQSFIRKRQN